MIDIHQMTDIGWRIMQLYLLEICDVVAEVSARLAAFILRMIPKV